MWKKSTLIILVMVLFTLSGQAQRPQKISGDITEGSLQLKSSYNPEDLSRVKAEKGFGQRLSSNADPLKANNNLSNNRLKALPFPVSPVEKLDSLVDYYFNPASGKWDIENAEYYLYDTKGRNYDAWSTYYDLQTLTMKPEARTVFRYSSDNQITTQSSYLWEEPTMSWINYFLDSMSYTVVGNIWKTVSYQYDTVLAKWIPFFQDEYSYDAGNVLIQQVSSYWLIDTIDRWENNSQILFNYDDQGRDTSRIESYWDGFTWYELYKTTTAYDAAGNIVQETDYSWDGELLQYNENWKVEYTYDASNREIERLEFSWDFFANNWFIAFKDESVWDASGNNIEEISSRYDTALQVYTPEWKDIYEYDLSVEMKDIAMPYWWYEDSGEDGDNLTTMNKVTSSVELTWNLQLQAYDSSIITSVNYSGLFDTPVTDVDCRADGYLM